MAILRKPSCVDFAEKALIAAKCFFPSREKIGGLKSARLAAEAAAFGVLEGSRAIFWGQYMRLCLHYLYTGYGYRRCDDDHTCV